MPGTGQLPYARPQRYKINRASASPSTPKLKLIELCLYPLFATELQSRLSMFTLTITRGRQLCVARHCPQFLLHSTSHVVVPLVTK